MNEIPPPSDRDKFMRKLEDFLKKNPLVNDEDASAENLLRQKMYDLLAHAVNPTEDEKRELREKRGLVFLPIGTQSYAELVAANPEHYCSGEQEFGNSRLELREYHPPVAVEVGFIESGLVLPDSFLSSRHKALQRIADYSLEIADYFPDFRAIGLPATGYGKADEVYAERNPGQVLFKNCAAWCLDNLFGDNGAFAGRLGLDDQFRVIEWNPRSGGPVVGSVPAVIKISR